MSGTLTFTPQEPHTSDPNFPSGYSYYTTVYGHGFQTFDFGRNRYYPLISSGSTIGIEVVDLSAMAVVQTVTLAQMYAGTAYGSPPGTPRAGDVWDIVTGNGTDIYLLISSDKTSQYFVRVDASTFKVTGELFGFGGHDLLNGTVNRTTSHTIVGYQTHPAYHLGLLIMDGTGMAAVGTTTAPDYSANGTTYIPAGTHPDGSCDFIMIDSDLGGSGLINIWRINVSDGLVVTTTKTGTFDANTVYDPSAGAGAALPQINYDAAHDAIILWLQQDSNGPVSWVTSVDWNGSLNWSTQIDNGTTTWANRGQAQLTGNTLMVGPATVPTILDTATGAVTFVGSLPSLDTGYYFHVWDASRSSYWTYILATYGFTRLDFVGDVPPPVFLTLDDVQVRTIPTPPCQIFLDWSDDRAHSFGSPVGQPMGALGEYRTFVQWQRLGYARDRVWRLSWSCPRPTALQGAWIELTAAKT